MIWLWSRICEFVALVREIVAFRGPLPEWERLAYEQIRREYA